MNIDATFWVAVSFIIFFAGLVYLKVPEKINLALHNQINEIKKELDEAERLKDEAKNLLSEYEIRLNQANENFKDVIENTKRRSEKFILEQTEKFHKQIEQKKKNTEEKIKRMGEYAIEDVKAASIKISFEVIENIIKNSIDKEKLNNFYHENFEQTKIALKKIRE